MPFNSNPDGSSPSLMHATGIQEVDLKMKISGIFNTIDNVIEICKDVKWTFAGLLVEHGFHTQITKKKKKKKRYQPQPCLTKYYRMYIVR